MQQPITYEIPLPSTSRFFQDLVQNKQEGGWVAAALERWNDGFEPSHPNFNASAPHCLMTGGLALPLIDRRGPHDMRELACTWKTFGTVAVVDIVTFLDRRCT
jgi:hypothetical protein